MNPTVTVVDPRIPELTVLAAGLAERSMLAHYVSGFSIPSARQGYLSTLPLLGRVARRRILPASIPAELVRQTAAPEDIVRAVCSRAPAFLRKPASALGGWMSYRRNRVLAAMAARLVLRDGSVVASWGTGLEAFRAAGTLGAVRLLDYPIAHHRYSRRMLLEEAELQPEFAGTMIELRLPRDVERRLDEECELADRILVGSSFVEQSFVQEGTARAKLSVIQYGVDVERFRPAERDQGNAFRVLFVGQIGQRKGISYLLEAYGRFRRPGTELLMVGNVVGDTRPLARYRDLFTHVKHAPHADMPPVFSSASVLVLPSLVEGLSLVVLEAMASGLPVIVSTNTGAADVVRDGIDGFIVPIRDVDAIAEKLDLLHRDHELRLRMGQSARNRAGEFTWDRYGGHVIDLLSELRASGNCQDRAIIARSAE